MEKAFRTACRAQLTKLIKGAEDILTNDPENAEKLEVCKVRVREAYDKLSSANDKYMQTISESDEAILTAEWTSILDYNDTAVKNLLELEVAIRKQNTHGDSTSFNPGTSNVTQTIPVVPAESNVTKSVRLPKLELIKFNGDLHQWAMFWEQYNAAIHNNVSLDDNAKFTYLKTLLTGKAAIAIQGLTPNQACYKDAIELLNNEFGNPEKLIDTYVQKLLALQPVKSRSDITSLKKLFNTATTVTRSLQALGISASQYGMMLKSVILKAIPYGLCIEYNKLKICDFSEDSDAASITSSASNKVSYDEQIAKLLNFLKVEIESVEHAQIISRDSENSKRPTNNSKVFEKRDKDDFTAAGLLTHTFKDNNCLFCSGNHSTVSCGSNISLERKRDILKSKKLCFRCTKGNHNSRNCRTKNLKCAKCDKRHATSMCDPKYLASQNGSNNDKSSSSLFTSQNANNVYLQTATAYIKNAEIAPTLIRLILDSGSQTTFIKETVSRQMNMEVIGTYNISIMPFGTTEAAPAKQCRRVKFKLQSKYRNETFELTAIEVPEICFDSFSPPSVQEPVLAEFAKNNHLADTKLDQRDFDGISLLIGADNYSRVITGEMKKLSERLTAVNTIFGWTFVGMDNHKTLSVNLDLSNVLFVRNSISDINVEDFWTLESIGIASDATVAKNSTTQFIEDKIVFNGERYEARLPWVHDNVTLDSNYNGALSRFKTLVNKLTKNSKLLEYDDVMCDYFRNDCAERVCEKESGKAYYMPHRPVYREEKDTTKVRIVFDASAHAQGLPSLNDVLDSGENLVPELLRVLLNFRIGDIALTADVEKAFLQISLNKDERDSHRFLWFEERLKDEQNLPNLAIYRMTRVTFGVTCSPFLLAATLKKHLSCQPEENKRVCEILSNSFYVDDLVLACNTLSEAEQIYYQSREILARAHMNLRKWDSNDSKLQEKFNNNEGNGVRKVLGILWNKNTDEFSVDLKPLLTELANKPATKRTVLSEMSKIYDPLGWCAPFSIRAKILVQEIWKQKIDWDDLLPTQLSADWLKWNLELPLLAELSFKRCILSNVSPLTQLHVFADASPQAYGAVAYIKDKDCHLIMSKNRIAPLAKKGNSSLTLPKLELTAALCAARLQDYILKHLNVPMTDIYLWTDSKIALAWIRGKPSKWKPYVSNRVMEIQQLTKGNWYHCPGPDNPADLLTRGIKAKTLLESDVWKFGPKWLMEDKKNWPLQEKELSTESVSTLLNPSTVREKQEDPLLCLENYSKLEHVLRVTAYTQRFIFNLKHPQELRTGVLSTVELENSLNYWIKHIQRKAFSNEINSLINNRQIDCSSKILSLNPQLHEDILRIGGRLQESDLPFSMKHPILLPNKSHFGDLLIWKCHFAVAHGGVNITLAQLRKKYWLIRGRQRIKTLLGKCVTCKKLKGKAGTEPFAPLPKDRIKVAHPFKVTGVDFAGPLYIFDDKGDKVKVYIMLLTCAVIRAVHLELVPDLTSESCVRALRRFFSRRGVPETIYSDNALTFKRVSKELSLLFQHLRQTKVQDLSTQLRIQWKFIVERAAWWGGFWERMVKTVKYALKAVLGKSRTTYDELNTLLTEVEAIVNSRPLTYIDNDPENIILTPGHFLFEGNMFVMEQDKSAISGDDILRLWRQRENLLKKFWKIWQADYLQQLRSAHYNQIPTLARNVQPGDIALLYEENTPRLHWKMVKIEKTFLGRDHRVRACEVRTGNGTILKRPIQLLFPLEVEVAGEDVKNISSNNRGA